MGTNRNEYEIVVDIIKTFSQIRYEISNVKFGLKISQSQCIGLENAFAGKILIVIKNSIYVNYKGLTSPFLLYSSDPNDGFNREKMILFIDNEIDILNNTKYFNQDSYYKSFTDRLLILMGDIPEQELFHSII